eukprot:GHVU01014419.1.p2 GENE.GHVU01014419.1~~GHVU01014419.1.p2  ORF type:complete len:123 (+),score=14.23 GHVU01014419.1:27-371(+)
MEQDEAKAADIGRKMKAHEQQVAQTRSRARHLESLLAAFAESTPTPVSTSSGGGSGATKGGGTSGGAAAPSGGGGREDTSRVNRVTEVQPAGGGQGSQSGSPVPRSGAIDVEMA